MKPNYENELDFSELSQLAEEFVKQNGISPLEAIRYNSDGEMRRRATYLLEHHLLAHHTVKTFGRPVFRDLHKVRIPKCLMSSVVLSDRWTTPRVPKS